jgi:outer membrane lipoprotein-sorting protein
MSKRSAVLVLGLLLLLVATAPQAQQGQQQYPIMDRVAQKIVDKYANSTCAQIAEMKSEKPQGEEAQMKERVIAMLKSDPQMRQAFINKVAAPIANKLFECGMIP